MILKPSEHIRVAADLLATQFSILDEETARNLREQIQKKFATQIRSEPLWHYLIDHFSYQDADSWQHLDDMLDGRAFIVFFDMKEDPAMLSFPPGSKFVPILADCIGFEYYLTDSEASFLICFNDHDFLIGVGPAAEWVEAQYEEDATTD